MPNLSLAIVENERFVRHTESRTEQMLYNMTVMRAHEQRKYVITAIDEVIDCLNRLMELVNRTLQIGVIVNMTSFELGALELKVKTQRLNSVMMN